MSTVQLKHVIRGSMGLLICFSIPSCLAEYVIRNDDSTSSVQGTDNAEESAVSESSDADSSEGTGEESGLPPTEAIPCGGHKYICDGECVSIRKNPLHCGACNVSCAEGLQCRKGECEKSCGDKCIWNLEQCVQGACQCRDGLHRCGTECIDLRSNPQHCGLCDRSCPEGACGDSICQTMTCSGFPNNCSGACTDVQTDALNCGLCGHQCKFDEVCFAGECQPYDRFDECLSCPCEPCNGTCCLSDFVGASICVDDTEC